MKWKAVIYKQKATAKVRLNVKVAGITKSRKTDRIIDLLRAL